MKMKNNKSSSGWDCTRQRSTVQAYLPSERVVRSNPLKTDCFKNIAPFFKWNEIVLFNLRMYFSRLQHHPPRIYVLVTGSFFLQGFNEFIALIKVLVSLGYVPYCKDIGDVLYPFVYSAAGCFTPFFLWLKGFFYLIEADGNRSNLIYNLYCKFRKTKNWYTVYWKCNFHFLC